MNIKLKSNDLGVICATLGFFQSQTKHKIVIETDDAQLNTFIKQAYCELPTYDAVTEFPTDPDIWDALDEVAHRRKEKEIKDIAGVVVTGLRKVPQRLPDLVATYFFTEFGLQGKGTVSFPHLTTKLPTLCIIDSEEKRVMAESYLAQYKLNSDIVNVSELSTLDQIKHTLGKHVKVAFLDAANPLIWVIYGLYDGWDKIRESYPCFITVDPDKPQNERMIAFWSACFPIHPLNTEEQGIVLAQTWQVREQYNFNHLEFLKKRAKDVQTETATA